MYEAIERHNYALIIYDRQHAQVVESVKHFQGYCMLHLSDVAGISAETVVESKRKGFDEIITSLDE